MNIGQIFANTARKFFFEEKLFIFKETNFLQIATKEKNSIANRIGGSFLLHTQ
jgi:hypothetical protein